METIHTDCCIAGGGPAGIILGYLLARAGIDVVILEKWPDFFRDFRGDTIHPSTMTILQELGLLDDFLKLPHNETKRIVGHVNGESIRVADFTKLHVPCPYVAFIPQWDFLNFITEKAQTFPKFHLRMETEAADIIEEQGRIVGVRAMHKGTTFDIRAALTIGADGRHLTIREKSKLVVEDFGAPIDVLWFRLPRIDDGTKQSLGYLAKGSVMVILDRDTYWQCGFVITKGGFSDIKERGLDAFKKTIADLVPALVSGVHELKDWDQVKLLTVSVDHLPTWYKEGLLCIGDSAHAMSPIGGVGINLAIQDAVAAANVLVPAFRHGGPKQSDLATIQKRRRFPTRLTQKMQVFLHRRVLGPVVNEKGKIRIPWYIRLLDKVPLLQWIPAHIIGIGFRSEHIRITF